MCRVSGAAIPDEFDVIKVFNDLITQIFKNIMAKCTIFEFRGKLGVENHLYRRHGRHFGVSKTSSHQFKGATLFLFYLLK